MDTVASSRRFEGSAGLANAPNCRPASGRLQFMARGYDAIREPLSLQEGGRSWFRGVLEHATHKRRGRALVLGATPWLVEYLASQYRVVVVDHSRDMLQRLHDHFVSVDGTSSAKAAVDLVEADWLDASSVEGAYDLIAGDNSLTFLQCPTQWVDLCHRLRSHMTSGSVLALRSWSVPATHVGKTVEVLVEEYLAAQVNNPTVLRTALLFSCWNKATNTIDTEQALLRYEAHRRLFAAVADANDDEDDLAAMEKYRGCGVTYCAPGLSDCIAALASSFRVVSVHFGQYPMAEYFPLIVAVPI